MNGMVNTQEQSRSRAAGAQAQDVLEENKKKIPIIQAKTRLKTAQNKMKSTLAQIRKALEEFVGLTDATDKEVAANQINYSWKRLISGEEDLKTATDRLAEILGEAKPTIMEEDAKQQIDQNENDRDEILLEWDTFRQKNMREIKAARSMVEHSNVNVEVPSSRGTVVQRRFSPDQSLKPKLLDESANLLEVKDFIIEFSNYVQSGYNPGETVATGH